MNETKAFICPTCGAPLDYRNSQEPTIRCPYCDTSVIVPEELRVKKPQEITPTVTVVLPKGLPAQIAAPEQIARRSIAAVLLAVSVSLVMITGLVAFLLTARKPARIPSGVQGMVQGLAHGPCRAVLTFGGEGTGPGMFQDARHVAVDGRGNIYVGEYQDGRIQVFDPAGRFLGLWRVDRKKVLTGFAVDRQGIAYAVLSGAGINRYEAATGKFLDKIVYQEDYGFEDVQVTADGGLVTFWCSIHDDIVRFDPQGKVVFTIQKAISGQTDESELSARIASDGLGNIFALGEFNNAVFKFSPEGKYLNRFGGEGDQPGQFRAPGAIAVDGQGRVFVSDFKGIQIFDGEGRYLDLLRVDGFAYGMAFGDRNELFVSTGKKVIKYEVTLGAK
jgi:streptogramin lyase/DNA-directed RNA polymerase subunit RPC12/RpoP